MQYLPRSFAGLGSYPQFILCQIAQKKGKSIKLPLDHRTMNAGNPHDRAIWMSFDEVKDKMAKLGSEYAIGFVFTEEDPFFFLDIDKCIDAETGELNEIATYLVSAFPGAAVERSQSGIGLHIFGTGHCPDHSCKNIPLGIELYTQERFVMLTGDDATGDIRLDCTLPLEVIVDAYFTPSEGGDDGEWNDFPHPDWSGPEDDDVLISKAMGARSASSVFNGRATFRDLFEANEVVLAAAYPDQGGREYDASSADAALAQHLAFWTGNNHERIQRIMEKSMLVREKWEDRGNYYLPMTIRKATSRQTEFYSSGHKPKPTTTASPSHTSTAPSFPGAPSTMKGKAVEGVAFMGVEEQVRHFDGCVYIRDLHRIFVPSGAFLNTERFRATYGGYAFAMDATASSTSKNAWEVFTESQAYRFPKVDGHFFRPLDAPGQITEDEGRTYVNTYIPITTPRVAGDATPFTDLVAKILPDERDRAILMAYLAGVVQYPGTKFQYCCVLQGTEGNGKSTLLRAVEYAVGKRYTHQPNSGELARGGGKFTGWLDGKLFIGVEEIHVPNKPGGLLDSLKPLLTNTRIELQAKGQDQAMGDNVANWLLLCNRKDDVPLTLDGRRYCVLFSQQQSHADCLASGMTDAYWSGFWNWIKKENGFAIINNYLQEFKIQDEFNPSMISRAPSTTVTEEAIDLTKTDLEQLLQLAISEERCGFAGGWVSSTLLHELFQDHNLYLPYNKTRIFMQSQGYDWHPAMASTGGKASRKVSAEGARPTLYVQREHMAASHTNAPAATSAYEKAQGYQLSPESAFALGANYAL